ncbi:MAG: restriction endonuclease [Thermoanaerobaculia bacterium]
MTIPDFQSMMLPLLRLLGDGEAHQNQATTDELAGLFGLSEEERLRLLPSGKQTVFSNRVAWAKSHFKRAGLIESVGRGVYRITDGGREVLASDPARIDLKFLDQFPGHREFRSGPKKADEPTSATAESALTPQEHIALGYQQMRDELASALLQQVKDCSPEFFEQLVVDLLVAMGYGGSRQDAGQALGRSGDGGIDGIIKEDRLGLDVIYLQAKRWGTTSVGRPEIQKFAGALQGQRAKKGVFITTSTFSKDAREYVSAIESKIILIDGDDLCDHMIDFGIGVTEIGSYTVKRLDSDYFSQE